MGTLREKEAVRCRGGRICEVKEYLEKNHAPTTQRDCRETGLSIFSARGAPLGTIGAGQASYRAYACSIDPSCSAIYAD